MTIGKVCNREVVIVDKEDSILTAALLMREYHVGDVIIVEEKEGERIPVGILTDRDIVRALVAEDVDVHAVTVGDAMSFDLLTANEEDEIADTIKRMRHRGVRRVPVVNRRGGLEGIVAADDLIELIGEQLTDLVALLRHQPEREEPRD